MNTLYLITGPAGVGKSTISKEIAIRKEKSVLIEGDDIYHHVIGSYVSPWKEGNHLNTFWKVCIETIKTYLNDGYDVVFNYIIEEENLEEIKNTFNNYKIKFVCLLTNEEDLIRRDKQRPEDCKMGDRCLVLLNDFKKGENHGYKSKNFTLGKEINCFSPVERRSPPSQRKESACSSWTPTRRATPPADWAFA